MKNELFDGSMLPITAAAAIAAGDGVLQGSAFGVACGSASQAGDTVVLQLTGVFKLPKATGQAWTVGAKLYWDNTAKNVTTTSTSNTLIGVAYAAAASGDTSGQVRLNGSF